MSHRHNVKSRNCTRQLGDAELAHCIDGTAVAIDDALAGYLSHRRSGDELQVRDLEDLCRFCVKLGRLHTEARKRRLDLLTVPPGGKQKGKPI